MYILYQILRPIIHFAFRVNFKKVYFLGWKNFPKEKIPTLVALNHPTSFLDPIFIAGNSIPQFHFILRGDMFKASAIVRWALRSIRTIPIFRSRDGFEGMRKNQAIFEYVNTLWNKNRNIIILVEGEVKHVKRLRTIQKGPARMALNFYEKYKNENLAFVPVCVNYTDSHKFRSYAMIEFGKPFYLKDYLDAYKENDRKAIRLITQRIKEEMKKLVIHIDKSEDDDFVNGLLEVNRNNMDIPIFPVVDRKTSTMAHEEIKIAQEVNNLDADEKTDLKSKTLKYLKLLSENSIEDVAVAKPSKACFVNYIYLILGYVPFLIAYIFHCPPLLFAKYFADKKVKKIEFHASVKIGVGMVLYFLYLLVWIISLIIIGNWWLIGALIIILLLGRFALIYRDFWEEVVLAKKFKSLNLEIQSKLISLRTEISNSINVLKSEG